MPDIRLTRTSLGPWVGALVLVAVALATRLSTLHDWAYFNDETFYYLAAQRMHAGAWLYADVWDRKGPGLFATYWLATAVSPTLTACRWLAMGFAAGTALVLMQIARRWCNLPGAVLAGVLYLAALPMFVGGGSQSQVFYNLYVAAAVLLVLRVEERRGGLWQLVLAMGLIGLAMTYKQTALCQGLALGGWALWRQWRLGAPWLRIARLAAGMALAGLAPTLLAAAVFAGGGRLWAFEYAMITANLVKHYNPWGDHLGRIQAMLIALSPLLVPAVIGLALGPVRDGAARPGRALPLVWLAGSVGELCIIPNFYADYTLPLLTPLSLCAGMAVSRRPWGLVGAAASLYVLLVSSPALNYAGRRAANAEVEALAARINARQPHARLLVYEGPLALYALGPVAPPSPLLHNFHLNFPFENNTSFRDTGEEMARILAWRPQVVVMYHDYDRAQENPRTSGQVRAYLARCKRWGQAPFHEIATTRTLDVWGQCAP